MEHTSLPFTTSFGVIREATTLDSDVLLGMVDRMAAHHGDISALNADILMRDVFSDPPWIYVLVAETEDRLVGYAALCGRAQLHFGVRGFEMHHLFAEAEFRRQGVGTQLVKACIVKSKAHQCRYLSVGTHPDNLDAQAFYVAQGFERRESYPPRFVMKLDERIALTEEVKVVS